MSDYMPDRWVVVKITGADSPAIHKVFACWYGGYAGSDSWKLNSGITQVTYKVTNKERLYLFEGSSGSVYECHADCYGTNMYGMSVLSNMIDKAAENGITIEILPEETIFTEIEYE
jgi:hypothetical protein